MYPLYLVTRPLKEITGQTPIFGDFLRLRINILQYHSALRRNLCTVLKTIAYNTDVHSLCVPNLLGYT